MAKKKSAAKAATAPVVEKSGNKGKRGSEAALEKKSGAKKVKNAEALQQAVEKKEAELKIQKIEESGSEISDKSNDEAEEPIVAPAKEVPVSDAANGSVPVKEVEDGSTPAAAAAAAEEEDSEGADSEDDSKGSSDESYDEPAKTPKGSDVKMKDATKNTQKTPSESENKGSTTLFAGNLSFKVDEDVLRDFFESAGEVVEIRLATDRNDGTFKGYGHIEFASEADAQKALKLNEKELLGRPIRLDLARPKGENAPSDRNDSSSQKAPTVFVKGFDSSLDEEEIRAKLEEHFGKCGEIARLSIPKDPETGGSKGFAYIEFKENDASQKAFALDQSEVGGFQLTVNEAKPRDGGGRGGGRGRGGGGRFGGGGGGRSSGGRFGGGGRRGRGGRGRDRFN